MEPSLQQRAWATDAARLVDLIPEALADELLTTMLSSGAVALRDGRFHARRCPPNSLRVPHPRAWLPCLTVIGRSSSTVTRLRYDRCGKRAHHPIARPAAARDT